MAKVSIIIPTYNVEMYLVECMESVVNQTLEDLEIICINDGSTDNSLEILKSYAQKDSRVIIVDKENGGYGMAMNIGLNKATGEYIGIVEPDDYVPVNMFGDLYKIAAENNLDFVKADFYRFKRDDATGDMELAYNHLSTEEKDYNKVFNPSVTPSAVNYIMNTWSGIYKREFLEKHGIRHNETPGASFQDNGFFFQTFAFAKRAMIVNKPYYMNRRDNPNSSVHSRDKVYCVNVEYDYIREILTQYPETWERFKYVYWRKKYSNYVFTLNRIGNEYKKEYVEYISREFKRAEQLGELSQDAFPVTQWSGVQFLMKDPEGYYRMVLMPGGAQAAAEIEKIKKSNSYRIGFAITSIPRRIKKALKALKRKLKG